MLLFWFGPAEMFLLSFSFWWQLVSSPRNWLKAPWHEFYISNLRFKTRHLHWQHIYWQGKPPQIRRVALMSLFSPLWFLRVLNIPGRQTKPARLSGSRQTVSGREIQQEKVCFRGNANTWPHLCISERLLTDYLCVSVHAFMFKLVFAARGTYFELWAKQGIIL